MKYFKPKKIIADTIVAEAISYYLAKPADELTKADLENVMRLDLEGTDITDEGSQGVGQAPESQRANLEWH